ncbi:MAG: radical SAM protein [Pseudomonadota bacterium]
MNIAIIVPCIRPYMDKAYFPTGIAYVATAMKEAGYEFDIIDMEAHRHTDDELSMLLQKKSYDVIALGTLVSGYKYVKGIVSIARKTNPNSVIIAGNSVASSIPEFLLQNTEVDIAVKGEGEKTMIDILSALEKGQPLEEINGIVFSRNGRIVDTGHRNPIEDISMIPHPDWELFDMKLYLEKSFQDVPEPYPIPKEDIRAFVVNTARGCPFRCTFCYHVFQYTHYRRRSVESILSEIATLQERYGINYVNFFDELTFSNKQQVRDFTDGVKKSGMRFFWNADIRSDLFTEKDLPLLHDVKQSGCMSFGYSLESGSPAILKTMNKKLKVEDFKRQKLALDQAGITSFTSIVLGYPQETLSTLKETFDVCYDLDIFPSTGYLLPQPGTPMFEVARQKGAADDLETYLLGMGDRQDLRFNLTDIPDEEFQREVAKHLKRINEKIGLGLSDDQLVKTFTFVTSKETSRYAEPSSEAAS